MPRAPLLIALLAMATPASAQSASGVLGVTAAVRAMETSPAPREETAEPQVLEIVSPRPDADALAAAAFRPGAAPQKPDREAPTVEVRAPEGYDEAERFKFKAAKIAYTRRF